MIADPNPTISWKRADPDGTFIEIKNTRDKFDGNYSIFDARLEDSGTYLCYASNSFGHDSYTTEVIIKPGINCIYMRSINKQAIPLSILGISVLKEKL